MTKERVSSDIDRKLRLELDAKAEQLDISRAELIKVAVESELGHFNVHKENKRLTEARAKAEQETEEARKQRDTFKTKFEESESNYRVCREKITLLFNRNWWERLRDIVPWTTRTFPPLEVKLPMQEPVDE